MKGSHFLFFGLGLVLVDILVPYLWLAEEPYFAASFLFWCLLTLAVIIGAGIRTRKWGKNR